MTRRLAVLFVLLCAVPAAAQVTYSTSVSAKDASGANAFVDSGAIDCSGATTACYVVFNWRRSVTQDFTSITHTGSSVTTLTSQTCRTATGGCLVTAYICNGGGSGNVRGTVNAATTVFISVIKLTGVDCAGTPVGTTAVSDSTGGTATSVTTNVTTSANGMAADGLMIRDSAAATPNAGQTQRQTQTDAGSMGLWSSTKPHTATSLGWDWTAGGSLEYVHSVTPFNASGGGGGATVPKLPIMGVGY